MNINDIEIGDRITFKVFTRWGLRSGTRVVQSFNHTHPKSTDDDTAWGKRISVNVRFEGASEFAIDMHEITNHIQGKQLVMEDEEQ